MKKKLNIYDSEIKLKHQDLPKSFLAQKTPQKECKKQTPRRKQVRCAAVIGLTYIHRPGPNRTDERKGKNFCRRVDSQHHLQPHCAPAPHQPCSPQPALFPTHQPAPALFQPQPPVPTTVPSLFPNPPVPHPSPSPPLVPCSCLFPTPACSSPTPQALFLCSPPAPLLPVSLFLFPPVLSAQLPPQLLPHPVQPLFLFLFHTLLSVPVHLTQNLFSTLSSCSCTPGPGSIPPPAPSPQFSPSPFPTPAPTTCSSLFLFHQLPACLPCSHSLFQPQPHPSPLPEIHSQPQPQPTQLIPASAPLQLLA
ncbi:uncharacterized protein LOC134209166 [Armigeres subalbatus]|uniref:uncharacterized protein LOC134209166 n=1 Tax=Armigeres subalbatus TaxID=124917 RepID=UPI002ED68A0B